MIFAASLAAVLLAQLLYDAVGPDARLRPAEEKITGVFDLFRPDMGAIAKTGGFKGFLEVLPSGGEIREFETNLEKSSVLRKMVLPPVQRVFTRLGGVGNEKVYPGEGGWLFFRENMDSITGNGFLDSFERPKDKNGQAFSPNPIPAIVAFDRQLKKKGIHLILMPTPAKASVCPEKMARAAKGEDGDFRNSSFASFASTVREKGVDLFDPKPVLDQMKKNYRCPFLKTDTHWTPEAVGAVANSLANAIRPRLSGPGFGKDPLYRFRAVPVSNSGDLTAMLQLEPSNQIFPPETVETRRITARDGGKWEPARNAEVLLLGDSYTNIYSNKAMGWGDSSGFAEQLSFALQGPLDRIALNGNSAYATRLALVRDLSRGINRLKNKKIVVYQFAERELFSGDWKLLDLPEVPEETGKAIEPATSRDNPARITGTISAVAGRPVPGETPYQDAITSVHLTDVKINGKKGQPHQAVVFLWALRDGKPTDIKYALNQAVEWEVVPWTRVEAEYDGYLRLEFEDPRLFHLPLYWVKTPEDEMRAKAEEKGEQTSGLKKDRAVGSERNHVPLPDETEKRQGEEPPGINENSPSITVSGPNGAIKIREIVEKAQARSKQLSGNVFPGANRFLFFAPEFNYLAASLPEPLEAASTNDPVRAISDFKDQLAQKGISLLVVPVPPKSAVYPDMLAPDADAPKNGDTLCRAFPGPCRFMERLEDRGVEVLDLTGPFLEHRSHSKDLLFCRTDSHLSPQGTALAADLILERIGSKGPAGLFEQKTDPYESRQTRIEFVGDLEKQLKGRDAKLEAMDMARITDPHTGQPVQSLKTSPLLVMGDSNVLVFNAGRDLHATGGGLPDHLAKGLGFPMDIMGVRGSGANSVRINLARKPDRLNGKKWVVWVFAARDFTEAAGGWKQIPVIR